MVHYFNELTPEERNELLHSTTVKVIVNFFVNKIFPKQKDFTLDIRKSTTIYSPAELDTLLREEGWERLDFDTNGWQQDTWYHYKHLNYDFKLVMEYSGFYGDLKLYREDIDD